MRIFLVEDNAELNKNIETTLKALQHQVLSFTDGEKALSKISKKFDLFIIDVMIPNVNGLLILKTIKKIDENIPCFIISGDTEIQTITKAYEIGADDYIKKPFDMQELDAKVKRVAKTLQSRVFLTPSCYYDFSRQTLVSHSKTIELTTKETALMQILIKNIGFTVPTSEIEDFVWGETVNNGHTRQLVSKVRKKLPCDIIKNHAGNGYKINKFKN